MKEYEIIIENLTKVYSNGTKAVDDLNLKVWKEELLGFLGPNGAGKTTTIKMIAGLLKPTSGRIIIAEKELRNGSSEYKMKIGVIPQETVIWDNLTVEENAMLIGRMYDLSGTYLKERVKFLLEELMLYEHRKKLGAQLSGGMRRRLNLIMGIVHDPEIIICDEPSVGMDPQSRNILWEYLKNLVKKEKKTMILTTHFMEEADKLSDRIAIIDHGKLLILDTPENLKKTVGDGDTVILKLENNARFDINVLKDIDDVLEIYGHNSEIRLRVKNAINNLPKILDILEQANIKPNDIKIRMNTLEDVFLALTGRELRE
ncbi:MAG: ATP-binding cassette domain-containing protein [Candidatus Odinarchaeota archaeon]|nr:ATP-binding cassette domain-containing protein [Candidatus Odinarchaeota archaeon]